MILRGWNFRYRKWQEILSQGRDGGRRRMMGWNRMMIRMRKSISDPEGLVAVYKVHIVMLEIQI